jgi:hypothetical protein
MKLLRIGSTGGDSFTLLHNIDEVRSYVDNYNTILEHTTNGIGDLSLLSDFAQAILLKFIEEGVTDVMCYASRDNVSPVLMSRFDVVEKLDSINIGVGDFATFVQLVQEKEGTIDSIDRLFTEKAANCLESYKVYRRLGKAVNVRIGKYL